MRNMVAKVKAIKAPKKPPLKLEYGAGPHPTGGYTSVDVCEANIQLATSEAVYKPVCKPGEASEILSIHFIEHFVRYDVRRLVEMWFAMLKPGGLLITCFPDMSMMSMQEIDRRLCLGKRPLLEHVFGAITAPALQELYRHKSFWTTSEFRGLLFDVGFSSVRDIQYRRPLHSRLWTAEVRAVK